MAKQVSKDKEVKPVPVAEKLPGGITETFKASPDKKGVYLLSDDSWFWYEAQAVKYAKKHKVKMEFVRNPHFEG